MTCQSFSSNYKSNRSSISLCDRLKQRYGNYQQGWQSLFQDQIQEKNVRDIEFIRYIVNFIIEQAKHNIVISELPDVIRTLHCEAEAMIRKNRMITLEEAIAQLQIAGAAKYPYLKKVKPISTEDFVKEVMREILNRLGTIVTLDMIENICLFTTCSAKQLLHAMPKIDVDEAATLIIEDISRNQRNINKNQTTLKNTIALSSSSTKAMNRQAYKKPEVTLSSVSKGWIQSERESSRSTQNSNQSHRKTRLTEHRNSLKTKKKSKSSKNSNKNHKNQFNNYTDPTEKQLLKLKKSNIHFAQMLTANPMMTTRRHKSIKKSKSKNVSSSICVPFGICSTEEYPLVETESKISNITAEKNTRKLIMNNLVEEQTINQEKDHKIKLSQSKSNTQTYSIHSEEGLSIQMKRPTNISALDINDNATAKQTLSSRTNVISFFNRAFHSKNHPLIIESTHNSDSKMFQSIRHYTKYCYQHPDISDDEEQTTDIDTEKCPLEEILNHRFIQ